MYLSETHLKLIWNAAWNTHPCQKYRGRCCDRGRCCHDYFLLVLLPIAPILIMHILSPTVFKHNRPDRPHSFWDGLQQSIGRSLIDGPTPETMVWNKPRRPDLKQCSHWYLKLDVKQGAWNIYMKLHLKLDLKLHMKLIWNCRGDHMKLIWNSAGEKKITAIYIYIYIYIYIFKILKT